MAQPPGRDIFAFLYLASMGPSVKIDARMVLTSAYSAVKLVSVEESINIDPSSSRTKFEPISISSLSVVETSLSCGVFDNLSGSSARIDEKKIGRVAFFEPEVLILPLKGVPPLITNLYIYLRTRQHFIN